MTASRIMPNLRPRNRICVLAAVLFVSTALPTVLSNPLGAYGYKPAYEPSYQPEYKPAYEPSYQPEYKPAYEPSYQPSYEPAYSAPTYSAPAYSPPAYSPPAYSAPAYPAPAYSAPAYSAPAYPSYSPEPAYAPSYTPSYAPSYSPKPSYYEEYDNYDAITHRMLNASIHCGVIPTSNDELYQGSKDVAPFGKYPWVVQITDDYNNFLCQGVMIQSGFVLTAKSCIYGSTDELRVRINDWDVLTNYNEYESHKNAEFRICDSFPVSYDASSSSYSYGGQNSQLIILEIDQGQKQNLNDKYAASRHICLPTYYQEYYSPPAYSPPAYSPPAYSPPAYQAAPSYGYPVAAAPAYQPSYSPPAYTPSYAPSYAPAYYSDCWVVGWYGSDATELRNHAPAIELQESSPAQSYGYSSPAPSYGYSSPAQSYGYAKPSYEQSYQKPQYYQEYYQYKDQSKIERRAKVKEIKCPYSQSYGSPPAYGGYGGYGGYKDEDVCFVGVDGHDACVADKGAAVFCLVPEKEKYSYESGYNNYDNSYKSSYSAGYNPAPYSASYGAYEQSYYKKDITAKISPAKPERYRAVLYAVVQKTAKCSPKYPQSSGYGYQQEQQSKPITATKITYQVVDAIEDNFWQNGMDNSCPAPKTYYPEPQYSYYAAPAYSPPAYQPSYEPSYAPPAYSPPAYSPPAYQPSYEPSYAPPAYSPPAYQPSYEPSYAPPAYSPPAYQPSYEPSYAPPAYSPPAYQPSYEPSYAPPAYSPPAYQPSYEPSYATPAYNPPSYQSYQPAYEPSYQSYEPSYSPPSYEPSYNPPSYEPAYSPPAYSPPPSYGYQG